MKYHKSKKFDTEEDVEFTDSKHLKEGVIKEYSSKVYNNDYRSNYYDNYYNNSYGSRSTGYSYGNNYYNKPYSSYWSSWYDSSYTVKEEKDELFIKNSESYLTPSSDELKREIGWGSSADAIKMGKELSRFFFYKMINEKDYIDEKYLDDSKLNDSQLSEKISKIETYNNLWDAAIPGYTPKEKAVYVIESLHRKTGKVPSEISDLKEHIIEKISIKDEILADPILNELYDTLQSKAEFNKFDILNKVSLLKNLGSKFKIEKEIEKKIVHNSSIRDIKLMTDISQICNVELYQRLLPNFKHKLLTKSLLVNVPVQKTEHKQKIIMLVDFSGSMCSTDKQQWVVAIMMDRLRMAIKEECEIFFTYFLQNVSEFSFHHIFDRESALEFWKSFSTRPNGGDTSVGTIITSIKDEIQKGKLFNINVDLSKELPEVLIINDGQDTVKTESFTYKTNAINLIQNNEQVKNLCIQNKGVHVHVNMNDNLTISE